MVFEQNMKCIVRNIKQNDSIVGCIEQYRFGQVIALPNNANVSQNRQTPRLVDLGDPRPFPMFTPL